MHRAMLAVSLCVLVACGGQKSPPPGGGTPPPASKRITVTLKKNPASDGRPCALETQERLL